MANRFPLVLDTTDNNKIKEIQSGDNLNLADNSIVGVQNIIAIGTIDAADIRVGGNKLVAQSFADLTDTPASFIGSPNYFVKVKADGTGLEYRPLSDLGNIEIDTITVDTSIIPSTNLVGNIGTLAARFNEIVASTLKGNLVSYNEEIVFNATTGKISYAALQGAPTFLSEFTDDVGYLRTIDLDNTLAGLFDEGQQFVTDIQGSVFGDDSTLLVDGVNSIVTGDILNTNIDTSFINASTIVAGISFTTPNLTGSTNSSLIIEAQANNNINIGQNNTNAVNIFNAVFETFDQGTGLGAAQITADTDLVITAGNRVKIDGGVPFGFASVSAGEQLAIGAQEGDVIYNTTTSRLQMYQGATWKDVNGNVEATSGTSNFNDVVVAGNLTVQGTTTSIDTANTTIKDNVIVLNNGEIGAGVTDGTSGIEIDRGDLANVTFVWNEAVDKWTLGAQTLVAATFEGNLTGNVSGNVTGNTSGTHTGAVIGDVTGNLTGNVVGDVVGSVFGDNSTLLVDGVNGTVPGTLTGDWTNLGSSFNVSGEGMIVSSESSSLTVGNTGLSFANTDDGENVAFTLSDGSVQLAGSGGLAITMEGTVGLSLSLSGTVSMATGAVAWAIDGNTSISSSGTVAMATGATSWLIDGDIGIDSTNFDISGNTVTATNFSGNVDNTTLTIGATAATTIAIGNSSSTTTINGIVSLPALIAGSITADDSISITTAAGDGNAISIGPDGTNTFVNLTADNIRFFGPITTTINATGGVIGDLKGSIVGDDSTILVDAVNSTIPYSVLDGAPTALSDFSNDLDYAGIVGTAIQSSGLPVDTFMTGTLDAQNNDIEDANLVNATGNLTGDVVGSVFADDSAVMVDAVNYALFSDTLSLTPLNVEPSNPTNGMIAVADGVGWDPASNARNTLVAYLGGAWVTVAAAA